MLLQFRIIEVDLIRIELILASIKEIPGSPDYHHYDGKRSVTISGDIDKDVITSTEVANLVQNKFESNYKRSGCNI